MVVAFFKVMSLLKHFSVCFLTIVHNSKEITLIMGKSQKVLRFIVERHQQLRNFARPVQNSRSYQLGQMVSQEHHLPMRSLEVLCCQPYAYKNQESESLSSELLASRFSSGLSLTPLSRGKKGIIFTVWYLKL